MLSSTCTRTFAFCSPLSKFLGRASMRLLCARTNLNVHSYKPADVRACMGLDPPTADMSGAASVISFLAFSALTGSLLPSADTHVLVCMISRYSLRSSATIGLESEMQSEFGARAPFNLTSTATLPPFSPFPSPPLIVALNTPGYTCVCGSTSVYLSRAHYRRYQGS